MYSRRDSCAHVSFQSNTGSSARTMLAVTGTYARCRKNRQARPLIFTTCFCVNAKRIFFWPADCTTSTRQGSVSGTCKICARTKAKSHCWHDYLAICVPSLALQTSHYQYYEYADCLGDEEKRVASCSLLCRATKDAHCASEVVSLTPHGDLRVGGRAHKHWIHVVRGALPTKFDLCLAPHATCTILSYISMSRKQSQGKQRLIG